MNRVYKSEAEKRNKRAGEEAREIGPFRDSGTFSIPVRGAPRVAGRQFYSLFTLPFTKDLVEPEMAAVHLAEGRGG